MSGNKCVTGHCETVQVEHIVIVLTSAACCEDSLCLWDKSKLQKLVILQQGHRSSAKYTYLWLERMILKIFFKEGEENNNSKINSWHMIDDPFAIWKRFKIPVCK